ncbi:MAG: ABC transporter ATP-binding protein, partial [Eudoraea sp.]|nr:ABC transporter ATP-binding protein [Eudoraea sp.]
YLPLGLWVLCTATSIYYSIRCFMPRMETKFDKNVFFFKDVISKFGSIRQFSKTFYKISLNEEELFDQLGQQIYINSKIADIKFKSVNRSIYYLATSLILLFIVGIWYMVISV